MGKTQPSLTHLVKTGLNHTEKPTKVGKTGFYQLFAKIFELQPIFCKYLSKSLPKIFFYTYIHLAIFGDASIVDFMPNYLMIF